MASKDKFANVQDCTLIENATLRSKCTYLYYYGRATESMNASYCTALPNTVNMSLLTAIFATNGSMLNPQQMELLLHNATPQSYCYYDLAVQIPNRSLCALASGFVNTLCNATFSSPVQGTNITNETAGMNITDEMAYCNYYAATEPLLKSECEFGILSALAISKRNVSLCAQISTAQYRYSCISSLAEKYGNASYCTDISNSTAEQECVTSVEYGGSVTNTTAG
jgi:hypothetical protein